MTRTWRHAALTVVVAMLLGAAAGCGDDDSSTGQGDPTGPATAASTSTSASSPADSSAPASPSITPASGITLTEESSSVRAPAGWVKTKPILSYASGATDPGKLSSVQLVDSGDISNGAPLDVQAQAALDTLPDGAQATRMPDVMLDGVAAYHIHYTVPGDPQEHDTITTVRNERNVGLDFILNKKNAATNPDLIASVIATFTWIA